MVAPSNNPSLLSSVFYLSAVLGADESGDGAEVVEVGAVQHPEE